MNLCEVLALYGQTLAPDEPVRLLIHHARDFNCSASLAAPMLRSKTVEQAPNPARAPERTQRDTLRRLLPEAVASATDIEIGEAAAASDARKEAEHHQRPHCATLLQDGSNASPMPFKAPAAPPHPRRLSAGDRRWQMPTQPGERAAPVAAVLRPKLEH